MCSPKKLTINLAIESIDSLKKRASMIKNVECQIKGRRDPCVKQSQVIPAPIRRIEKKQIEICKCPTVEFVCPPVPCVCPPCPICPTPAERLKTYLKAGLKLTALYVMVNFMSDEFTSKHQEIRLWKFKARKIRRLPEKRLLLGIQSVLLFGSFRWTVDQHLWGTADHTSNLTNYYMSIINAILYGEQESSELKAKSSPGFFDIRRAVYKTQLMWNKIISTLFYVTIGLPVHYMNVIKESLTHKDEINEEDETIEEINEEDETIEEINEEVETIE